MFALTPFVPEVAILESSPVTTTFQGLPAPTPSHPKHPHVPLDEAVLLEPGSTHRGTHAAHSAVIYLRGGRLDSLPCSVHTAAGGAGSEITPSAPHPRFPHRLLAKPHCLVLFLAPRNSALFLNGTQALWNVLSSLQPQPHMRSGWAVASLSPGTGREQWVPLQKAPAQGSIPLPLWLPLRRATAPSRSPHCWLCPTLSYIHYLSWDGEQSNRFGPAWKLGRQQEGVTGELCWGIRNTPEHKQTEVHPSSPPWGC